ncbi:nuclear transport factor 2 family protein [Corynebacterium pacaense]|uniref:nuclear transport factor 2 family protein n=1 Tax=Corynebacterium pacaense TaxID=1816684 RepID=UPI0009B98C8E|nr:nuclear transport factor 2 family protein [Corynebacterium pacaense]
MTTSALPEPVAGFIGHVNAHDETAFLDAFTPEGVVDDWGRVFTGREEIKTWSDKEFIGAGGILTVESVESDGSRVTVIGDWRSSHANGRARFIFEIDGDKLESMTIRKV